MSTAAFGLWLIGAVAAATVLTGLPAYVVLLLGAISGASVGLAVGAIGTDVLLGIGLRLTNLLENDLLQALPLFLLMGALLDRLPITQALFRCGMALFGSGRAAPVASGFLLGAMLAPMNGSVGASVAALDQALGPQLTALNVPRPTREAVIAVGGTLGVVVPPSLVLILLGDAMFSAHTIAMYATNRVGRVMNTQDLMRGALVPVALFLLLSLVVALLATRGRAYTEGSTPALPRPTHLEVWMALAASAGLLVLLGGVATGRLYAVEAAAVGVVALFVSAAATGHLRGGMLTALLDRVLVGTGTLFAPLRAATTFTLVLRLLGTDKLVESWLAALPGGPAVSVAVVLCALALLATALDAFEIIFVAVPVLVPALLMRVEDAVWVGVLVLLVLQTSFLLPPMGYAWVLARAAPGRGPFDFSARSDGSRPPAERALARGSLCALTQVLVRQ